MQKKIIGMLLASSLVFGLAACGSADKKDEATKTEPKTEQPAQKPADNTAAKDVKPTGKTVEVTVTAKSFEFDVKEIKAHLGDKVVVHLVNADGAHGFGLDEFGVDIKGGETASFIVNKKGTFEYYCSLMCGVGHDKMIGKLIVE
jgi:cytochrome c oxidase subunit 2